ncbi:FAD-binding and (Fe-S)-binding domain-containing protein [Aquisphaera insulae]|uniref:FAD-binding and (Fe-S)-binding domain-containing protein n=1 Tax=Aquisphaera insulae TaxID=2712864 RepID=UPI0013EE1A1A|nr:FAD-binding and (Fe-S)-binding domain-containing protein [Aquisphaera insulae]
MDERRARIYDDLRGVIDGELEFEPLARGSYAYGASLYEIDPLGVIAPRTENDVLAVVGYAAEHQIPIHARGAATDSGGGALGPGIVIDFSRHLRKILQVSGDRVVVEPGVSLDTLNAHLAPLGRRVEPVPVNAAIGTVGGMIAVDAAGERSPRFGSMSDRVDQLRVAFPQGDTADVGFVPWPSPEDDPRTLTDLHVRKLLNIHRQAQRRPRPASASLPRNRAGYALDRACSAEGINLARLICGSEGTLALVLQAALRTIPLPGAQGAALFPFGRLADAAEAARECLEMGLMPAACDLYDWRLLSLARDADDSLRDWIPESARSAIVVEFEADSADEVADVLRRLETRLGRGGRFQGEPAAMTRRADCDRLVGLRRLAEPLLLKSAGAARPISAVDDVAVPPDLLGPVMLRFQEVMKRLDIMWTLSAGAADGRIRLRPFLDLANPEDRARIEPMAAELYEIVLEARGTISASSGCGLSRTQFLARQFGEYAQTFREIKDVFDPAGLLNPGKVIGDDPHQMARDLKRFPPGGMASIPDSVLVAVGSGSGNSKGGSAVYRTMTAADPPGGPVASPAAAEGPGEPSISPGDVILPVLRWPEPGAVGIASACHGCGACRSLDPSMRMCPSFRAHRREEASPRSQANMIRQIASGAVDPRLWGSEEALAHASLCIHCKLCKSECPAEVDVSGLMLEAKAAYVENHGLPPWDWVFSRLEMWAGLASRFPILSNFLLSRRNARRVIERVLGVSRHRVLPPVQRTPFTRRAARMGLGKARPHEPGPRVAYFVDLYANYYDHELAEAVVQVLRRAEVNVFVPPGQRSSGMAPLIVGDIDYARDIAVSNLRVLGNAVRDGYTIVCSEPTAALMLRQEYIRLIGDLDADLVAQNTMDLGQYLNGLDARGQLPAPTEPLHARVGYHQPCHLRALEVGIPGLDLIRKIPDLDVEFINRGCSGMGGTYGLARDQFRTSLRAGRPLLRRLRDDDIEIGSTECGACRIQMEQGQTKRTLHPIKLLSLAYGLNPSLRRHFKDSKQRHVMA